jgi:hypothetical protein
VRKNENSGGTSLARAYAKKKMKSPGSMLASDAILCFSLGSGPGACHPISHHRLARELIVLYREVGSSAAMVMDGGQRLRRKQEARENNRQKRRAQDGRRMELWINMAEESPVFIFFKNLLVYRSIFLVFVFFKIFKKK